jgi:hypothetical protein
MPNPHPYRHDEKLTDVVDSTLPGFHLRLRMPGWLPDTVIETNPQTSVDQPREVLYVEEVLGGFSTGLKTERIPFQPPLDNLEDTRWILGSWVHEVRKVGGVDEEVPFAQWNPFNRWLHQISKRARNYNAALYRLRRVHLDAEHNTAKMPELPTDSHVSEDPPETLYKHAVERLRQIVLTPPAHPEDHDVYDLPVVDFVQVNGYIVSIRAVTRVKRNGFKSNMLGPQPVGSDSSHWSLSSPFSSYYP